MFVPPTPPQPSPEEQRLSDRLLQVAQEHLAQHPGSGLSGVVRAFRLTQQRLAAQHSGGDAGARAVVAVVLALLMLGLGVGAFFFTSTGGDPQPVLLAAVAGLALVAGLAVAATKMKLSGGDPKPVIAILVSLLLLGLMAAFCFFRSAGPALPLN